MVEANCPSCGAPLQFVSKASLYAVCPYCDSQVMRNDLELEKIGEVAHLQEDSSPIQLGTQGRFADRSFEVVGRIQLQFPRGYWNEWFVWTSDGREAWLGEAQGSYAFTQLVEPPEPLPAFDSLAPRQRVKIGRDVFFVKDKQQARCIGGEGELPFQVRSGYEAPVIDLESYDRRFATLDYSEDPPLLFIGHLATFDELELHNLRQLEGW